MKKLLVLIATLVLIAASTSIASAGADYPTRSGGSGLNGMMRWGQPAPTYPSQFMPRHFSQHITHPAIHPAHIQVRLHQVAGTGVLGFVDLIQRGHASGTLVTVVAFGLRPGNQYISLFYANHFCQLEPYSAQNVVGGVYTANAGTVGTTQGNIRPNLNMVNSVSVRRAGDFALLGCADRRTSWVLGCVADDSHRRMRGSDK